jgi:hypothetical protein
MRKRRLCLVPVTLMLSLLCDSTRCQPLQSAPGLDDNTGLRLPTNVFANDLMKPVLYEILKRSATFRRQCFEIDQARHLRIRIGFVPRISWPPCRALSVVKTYIYGYIEITISIPAATQHYIELIGHEFEHALEQVEGLDLRVLASTKGSQVRRLEDGSFETGRAIRAGCAIANEFKVFRRPLSN